MKKFKSDYLNTIIQTALILLKSVHFYEILYAYDNRKYSYIMNVLYINLFK